MVRLDRHHGPPSPVWEVKVFDRTVTPPWTTVMVALVNFTWVMVAVQLSFGHPPSVPDTGLGGGFVVTLMATVPFLIALAGIAWVPVTVTLPGFCPGAWLPLPGFEQVEVGVAVAERVTRISPFPRPARSPAAVSVRPLSVNVGDLGLKWTLAA